MVGLPDPRCLRLKLPGRAPRFTGALGELSEEVLHASRQLLITALEQEPGGL